MRLVEGRLLEAVYSPVNVRLANFLLASADPVSGVMTNISHEEIGNTIGAARQTVTTNLNTMRKQGILIIKQKMIQIMDRSRLEEIIRAPRINHWIIKMIVVNINPIAFSIGALSVRWYGLMYVVGITIGLLVAWPYAKWKGFTEDQLEKVVYWAVPAGLVGARLYYVVQQPLGPFLSQPWRIFGRLGRRHGFLRSDFCSGHCDISGRWRMKISVLKFLDVAALFASVGQFFGRIGNFINGDIIGYPTKLPWGVIYANPNSFAPQHDIAYQPAAAYEALIDILLFIIHLVAS